MFLYTGQQTNHSHSTLSFNDVSPQSWDALKLENDIAWLMDYIGIPAWEHNRRRHPLIASLFVCAFCQKFLWESLLRGDPAEGSVAKMRFFLFLRADVVVAVVLYSLFPFLIYFILFNCVCMDTLWTSWGEVNTIDPCYSGTGIEEQTRWKQTHTVASLILPPLSVSSIFQKAKRCVVASWRRTTNKSFTIIYWIVVFIIIMFTQRKEEKSRCTVSHLGKPGKRRD